MSKFITTTEISYQIELLIRDAKDFIILMSPYINIHERLKVIIEEKIKNSDVNLVVVCKKKDLQKKEYDWMILNSKIKLVYKENLHAKCYMNEKKAILTSMNLYDYSMVNNIEFGFDIDKEEDENIFQKILNECNSCLPDNIRVYSLIKLTNKFTLEDETVA